MFTGIVEEIGTVDALEVGDGAARLRIDASKVLEGTRIGDSISVDGCCLTVTEVDASGFSADMMAETLAVTALSQLDVASEVNLERAMSADGRFGGHLVQGHVDGVGSVTGIDRDDGNLVVEVAAPEQVLEVTVPKGSVAVSGVSLTVIELTDGGFTVGVIPHTARVTTLGRLEPGARVNLEADVIGKYVARLLAADVDSPYRVTAPSDIEDPQ